MNRHLVIMAGGIGSRFWPMSRPEQPKQFIDVLGVGKTLIQLTVERFGGMITPERIWVVTSANYKELVREQLPQIPEENILMEPCMRNTAPCIGYVAWKIRKREPEASIVVSPADHFVLDTAEFRRTIERAFDFIEGSARVLTLGMQPTRPDTGYGYIQSASEVGGGVCKVAAFKEKPQREIAEQYLREGGYYWNAGIFIWTAETAEAAIREFEPEMAQIFDIMSARFDTALEQEVVNELFPNCKSISIDYAVMERLGGKEISLGGKTSGVYVMPSDFGWSDLGTWGSLYTHVEKDENQNAIIGMKNVSMIESTNCIVRASGDIKMVLQGLDNYIVADDNGILMVCQKDQEQRIKSFSETLKD